MAHHIFYLLSLLAVLTLAATRIGAVEYIVTNRAPTTPGGIRFNNELGADYTKQTMASASEFIWSVFEQTSDADRRNVPTVNLFVDDMDGIAYVINDEVHVGDDYIEGIKGDIKWDFNGVLYHEMTHIWQWNGNGQAPGGLIEGIADYVRLKANYAPSHWVKPGGGDKWDQGYDVTAKFLDYCNDLRNGFVAELNKKMRTGYSDDFFVQLLGKTVDQLWSDYKAKYAN